MTRFWEKKTSARYDVNVNRFSTNVNSDVICQLRATESLAPTV